MITCFTGVIFILKPEFLGFSHTELDDSQILEPQSFAFKVFVFLGCPLAFGVICTSARFILQVMPLEPMMLIYCIISVVACGLFSF
jgi:hypothetical protein